MSWSDWRIFDSDSICGHPDVVALSSNQLLVSTCYLGSCLSLGLKERSIRVEPTYRDPLIANDSLVAQVMHSFALYSPSASTEGHPVCAIAFRACWADYWKLGGQSCKRIYPVGDGSVNTVRVHPRGHLIALGLGYYPLDPDSTSNAREEVWKIGEDEACIASQLLPGVAVDRMAWDSSGDCLLAVSGSRSQDRAHVTLLDGVTLRILGMVEIASCRCRSLYLNVSDGHVIVVMGDRIEVRFCSSFGQAARVWSLEQEEHAADFTPSGDTALLSSGILINVWSGERHLLPSLSGCTGVAMLPGVGGVGISDSGLLRIWEFGL